MTPSLGAFAAVSDSLAADLRDYQSRAPRFAWWRTDCPGLGGAFATLEQRWITYSVQRPKLAGPLDPARAATDTAFYSGWTPSNRAMRDRDVPDRRANGASVRCLALRQGKNHVVLWAGVDWHRVPWLGGDRGADMPRGRA